MSRILHLRGGLAIVFVLVAVIIGYTGWRSFGNRNRSENPGDSLNKPITTNNSNTSEIDISNWETYLDTRYRFEVRFPADWEFESPSYFAHVTFYNPKDGSPKSIPPYGGMINILILKSPGKYSLRERLERGSQFEIKETSIGGFQAFEEKITEKIINDDEEQHRIVGRNIYISSNDPNIFYLMSLFYPKPMENEEYYDRVFNKFASTFKFIE
jgi:hypothetical protein